MKVSIRHSFLGCHQSSSRESSRIYPFIWLLTAGFTHWQNLPVCTHTYHCTFDWILSPKEWVFLKSGIFAIFSMIALNFNQSLTQDLAFGKAKKEWTLSTAKNILYISQTIITNCSQYCGLLYLFHHHLSCNARRPFFMFATLSIVGQKALSGSTTKRLCLLFWTG